MKKGTKEEKLAAAKKYYNKKDYVRAQPLFEELLGLYYNQAQKEDIYYYFTYTHYGLGEFILAGYHFKNFAQTYAMSPRKEEASYMAAICEFHKSMPHELDQTPTKAAINSLQVFINQYPNSTYVEECNKKIDELRIRLLEKVYHNATLYYHLGQFKSAIVACTNAVEDYPDIINRDELSFLIVESNYFFAKNSIVKMQKERFENTILAASAFKKEFKPENKYFKEVSKIIDKVQKELALVSTETNNKKSK